MTADDPVPLTVDVILIVTAPDTVLVPEPETEPNTEAVPEPDTVTVAAIVVDILEVILGGKRLTDSDVERVIEGVGGSAVPLTEAASKPTLISIPQAWGRVRVAE